MNDSCHSCRLSFAFSPISMLCRPIILAHYCVTVQLMCCSLPLSHPPVVFSAITVFLQPGNPEPLLESCRVSQRVMNMAKLEGAAPSIHLKISLYAIVFFVRKKHYDQSEEYQRLPTELTNRWDSCPIQSVKQQSFWPAYIRYTNVIG